jgi:hypothetical protein
MSDRQISRIVVRWRLTTDCYCLGTLFARVGTCPYRSNEVSLLDLGKGGGAGRSAGAEVGGFGITDGVVSVSRSISSFSFVCDVVGITTALAWRRARTLRASSSPSLSSANSASDDFACTSFLRSQVFSR